MTLRKKCPRCGKEKPLDDFHHSDDAADRHQGYCKKCNNERQYEPGGAAYPKKRS
ncbi:hypothetical protein [Nannocystis bainbridge]|uniref:HNH endonuclease n=1 Tax=Nannocystis bainbridge TaxID=2995303 RepID=A0ABT5E462_9BACT|nr:hypothetical protein [Nannocystis bainbridge]MDC0720653.1 hypothetical protein [Nannocystis bainbridge]